jgi:hypothetical protein
MSTAVLTFTITPEHIKLLKNASVRWDDCEFGAPAIDCKRPYGNSSVILDMVEILGYSPGSYPEEHLRRIHKETEQALQIFLQTGEMKTGRYEYDWKTGWKLAPYVG